ncbi:formate--tetrahydrofolate ligase, partial [Erysipelatoclostridium ramosum]|nr:formate--tetrahydrofolate ligase [Thomasclavelia ramosa]
IPALRETAEELGFRDPIVGNLFRDGGEALAPQLDAFVEAVSDEALPERPKSFKGESLREKIEFVCGNAY